MHRYAKTLLVIGASVAAGACAGKVTVAVVPPLPPIVAEGDLADPENPLSPPEDIAILPVREMSLDELLPAAPPEPSCDIAAVVAQTPTDPELAAYPVAAGTKLHSYVEVRFDRLDRRTDYELDIGVRVLDPATCTTEVIGVRKTYGTGMVRVPVRTKGGVVYKDQKQPVARLEAPAGWQMEVVRRVQGVEWNNWGTEFHITEPAGRIVVGVRWPHVPSKRAAGAPRVTPVTYVPYSHELHGDGLIAAGRNYLDDLGRRAYEELRRRGVMSKAFPDMLVADVPVLEPQFVTSLAANEHMDPGEFALDPEWTADRIHIVIGANRERTAAYTCSSADACGLMQFTDQWGRDRKTGKRLPGTYSMVRLGYPAAKLMPDFTAGARDHLNAMMAAVLLHDLNLAYFRERFGEDGFARLLADRTLLRELSNCAYNTGASRCANVGLLALKKQLDEWTEAKGSCRKPEYAECLLLETKGYIAKDRFLNLFYYPGLYAVKP